MKRNEEIPIGGIGTIYGIKVMAKEYLPENDCDECCFSRNANYHHTCPFKTCDGKRREDKKHVYFVRVE